MDEGLEQKRLDTREPEAARLICGVLASDAAVLDAACGALSEAWGPVALRSEARPFRHTDYYTPEMGVNLLRCLLCFEGDFSPGRLADKKCESERIEARFRRPPSDGGGRRVNLDPGYVTAAKLVLASTKNFAHRIYLRDGIYAEVTLQFARRGVRVLPWTYPDFASGDYNPFLLAARGLVLAASARGG